MPNNVPDLGIDLGSPGDNPASRGSSKDRIGQLADQVERPRRSNVRLSVAAALGPVLTVAVAVGFLALAKPSRLPEKATVRHGADGIIEARGIVIRDEDGAIRATLGYEDKVSASLKLFDAGRLATEYWVPSRGMGFLDFNHPDGLPAMQLGGGSGGDSSINMYDTKSDNQVSINAGREGGSLFTMSRAKEHQRFQLGVHGFNGVAFFDFFDDRGNVLPVVDKAGVPLR
jgi:hypothetical protein